MAAQIDTKTQAKAHIVKEINSDCFQMGISSSQVVDILLSGGFIVSRTTVRRYMSELMEDGIVSKVGNLYKIVRQAEEVVEEEVVEPVVEEEVAENNIEEVDDDKILETVIRLASDIIRAGRTASFQAEFTDGSSKTFACNNLDRLPSVISKILPDESLIQKVEVFEATADKIQSTPKAEEKKVEEKKDGEKKDGEKKKGGRTKKAEPAAKPAKPSKYTRAHALADVLKQAKLSNFRLTKADLIMHSNNQYIGHGGKDNLKEAKWYFSNVVGILELMGTIRVDGEHVEVV